MRIILNIPQTSNLSDNGDFIEFICFILEVPYFGQGVEENAVTKKMGLFFHGYDWTFNPINMC